MVVPGGRGLGELGLFPSEMEDVNGLNVKVVPWF